MSAKREQMILTRARTLAEVNNLPLRWLLFSGHNKLFALRARCGRDARDPSRSLDALKGLFRLGSRASLVEFIVIEPGRGSVPEMLRLKELGAKDDRRTPLPWP